MIIVEHVIEEINDDAKKAWDDEMESLKSELDNNEHVSCIHIFLGFIINFCDNLCTLHRRRDNEY